MPAIGGAREGANQQCRQSAVPALSSAGVGRAVDEYCGTQQCRHSAVPKATYRQRALEPGAFCASLIELRVWDLTRARAFSSGADRSSYKNVVLSPTVIFSIRTRSDLKADSWEKAWPIPCRTEDDMQMRSSVECRSELTADCWGQAWPNVDPSRVRVAGNSLPERRSQRKATLLETS